MVGKHGAMFFFKRAIWTDILYVLQPLSKKKAQLHVVARKRGSGWQSRGRRGKSRNLRGDKGRLKIERSKESGRVF